MLSLPDSLLSAPKIVTFSLMHHFQCPATKNSAENHCGFWLSFQGKLLLSADITVLLSSFWCINSKKHVPEWPGRLKPEESLDLFIFLLLKKHSMGKGCETKGYGGDVHYPTNDLTFIFFLKINDDQGLKMLV